MVTKVAMVVFLWLNLCLILNLDPLLNPSTQKLHRYHYSFKLNNDALRSEGYSIFATLTPKYPNINSPNDS